MSSSCAPQCGLHGCGCKGRAGEARRQVQVPASLGPPARRSARSPLRTLSAEQDTDILRAPAGGTSMGQGLYLGKQVDPATGALGGAPRARPRRPADPRAHRGHDGVGQDRPRDRPPRGAAAPGRSGPRHRPEGRPRQPPAPLRRPRRGLRSSRGSTPRRRGARARTWRPRRRGRGGVEEGPRRVGPRAGGRRGAARSRHDAVVYTPGLEGGRAAERAAVARRAVRSRSTPPRRTCATRSQSHRGRAARPRARRRRPAAVAAGRLPRRRSIEQRVARGARASTSRA